MPGPGALTAMAVNSMPLSPIARALMSVACFVPALFATAGPEGWRGDGSGTFPDVNPPTSWSPQSNIVWKTKLPGFSNSSPILIGDRLFVCSEIATLLCLSAADGHVLWAGTNTYEDLLPAAEREAFRDGEKRARELRKSVLDTQKRLNQAQAKLKNAGNETDSAKADLQKQIDEARRALQPLQTELKPLAEKYLLPETNPVNGYSTPTPTGDGQGVYVLFGNGVAAAYDLSGHRRWARVVDRPSSGWGHSASPLLVGNKLVVHVRRLIALDAATGSNVWQAAGDPRWGSPVLARIGSQEVCVTPGGDVVNVSDGAVLARKVSNLDFCTPLVREGIAYFVQHGGRAIRLPEPSGPESMPETLWTTKPENDRYYASPVLRDGVLYATTQKGHLSLIDAATGEVLCSKDLKLGGTAYPSIVSAGPYVYVSSDSGCTVLLKPGRQIEVFATNRLEPFRSSMLFAGTRLYVRGLQHMYCIGNPSP